MSIYIIIYIYIFVYIYIDCLEFRIVQSSFFRHCLTQFDLEFVCVVLLYVCFFTPMLFASYIASLYKYLSFIHIINIYKHKDFQTR